ncbi:MAG TPA: hypothetical protein VF796_22455 [Humisphaera sp.]
MTLQLRPTFSESWYRVKHLKVKLRPGAQISRQYYRGERWYVVRDPAGNQYHRLSDPAYRFVGLLDGSRTVEEAWDLCGGTMADDAPTQPEVIQILTHLYGANLIDADVTPDATVLLRRHKTQKQKKFQQRLMNVLFPRIPLWDPDRFLVRWMPLVRQMFSRFGALVWLAVVVGACVFVASKSRDPSHDVFEAAKHSINLEANPQNVVWLWGVFVFVKLIHELGHAFGCRRFGGECHELGIMFLVFIPTPYVDASTAWSFSNKWQRIFVGCAGMIVELFFASLCAIAWCLMGDPMHEFWGQLAFNAMLVASVTTIIFNANPLLRYDGYYILSDWLEIPNLRQKSQDYTLGLLKRHVFRVKQQQPLPPVVQRVWLFLYYCTSGVYRIFVGVMIILLVAFQIPILGILMSIGGLITWLVMPVFKIFKYLTIEPELHRKRGRATAFVLAVAAAIVVVIGVIPMPVRLYAMGIVEPSEKTVVYAGATGIVADVPAEDGMELRAGDPIVVCRTDDVDARIMAAEAEIELKSVQLQQAGVVAPEKRVGLEGELRNARRKLRALVREKAQLTVRAPTSGWLIAPRIKEMRGQSLGISAPVGAIVHKAYETAVPVRADGPVAKVLVANGARVTEGQVIVECSPEWLDADVALIEENLGAMLADREQVGPQLAAMSDRDPVRVLVQSRLDLLDKGIARARADIVRKQAMRPNLLVRAPRAGVLDAPQLDRKDFVGTSLWEGGTVGVVRDPAAPAQAEAPRYDKLTIHVALGQNDAQLLPEYARLRAAAAERAQARQAGKPEPDQWVAMGDVATDVRFAGRVGDAMPLAVMPRSNGAAVQELRHPSLGQAGGGEIPVRPDDPKKALEPVYDVELTLDNPQGLQPGQRAYVRFTTDHKPLAWQWARRIRQTLKEHAAASKWL